MEIQLVHIEVKNIEIDFQKIFDYMYNESNKSEPYESIDDYNIAFADNVEYYLKNIYNLDFDGYNDSYYELNDYTYDLLADGFYKWLNENKERLNITD